MKDEIIQKKYRKKISRRESYRMRPGKAKKKGHEKERKETNKGDNKGRKTKQKILKENN